MLVVIFLLCKSKFSRFPTQLNNPPFHIPKKWHFANAFIKVANGKPTTYIKVLSLLLELFFPHIALSSLHDKK
jgi:hypothetical protein